MKALSTSIVIVVTVLTVLVVALVVLTIFSGGISQVNTITNFRNNCITQCQITCKMGALPPTWKAQVKIQGETNTVSCDDKVEDELNSCGCTETGGTTGATCTGTPPLCTGSAGCKVCTSGNTQVCGIC